MLNDLQKEKIRTDAARKTEIETQRVREDASADLTKAKADLTKEQTQLAEEQRKTANAQRAADEARLALQKHVEEVAERQKNRHLTSGQQSEIIAKLRTHAPPTTVLVIWEGDEETRDFASELVAVLRQAGWRADLMQSPLTLDGLAPSRSGNWVFSTPSLFPFARSIYQALSKIGIDLKLKKGGPEDEKDEPRMTLGIGLRP